MCNFVVKGLRAMPTPRRLWSRNEFILALNLYYKLPFGKIHTRTKEIQELAKLLNRTASSIAYRLANYAACDPYITATGRRGMTAGKKQCQPFWDEFANDREKLLFESERILAELQGTTIEQKFRANLLDISNYTGEEKIREVATRVNQFIFREKILSNYDYKCALTGIDIQQLLVASHIIPWSRNKEERLNPANGICLSSLYDDAFDKGFIGFDKGYRVVLSDRLKEHQEKPYYDTFFGSLNGQKLILPVEFQPNIQFLEWHMDEVFLR